MFCVHSLRFWNRPKHWQVGQNWSSWERSHLLNCIFDLVKKKHLNANIQNISCTFFSQQAQQKDKNLLNFLDELTHLEEASRFVVLENPKPDSTYSNPLPQWVASLSLLFTYYIIYFLDGLQFYNRDSSISNGDRVKMAIQFVVTKISTVIKRSPQKTNCTDCKKKL